MLRPAGFGGGAGTGTVVITQEPIAEDALLAALLAEEEALQEVREQNVLERLGLAYATSYRTIPAAELPYLRGREPTGGDPAEAALWEWEPVTQKFVNRAARQYLTRDEYLAAFYPDVLAERTRCRRVPVESLTLTPGLPAAAVPELAAGKPPDAAAAAIYVMSPEGDLVGSDALVVRGEATRADIVDALRARGAIAPDAGDYRVTAVHPRLFEFGAGAPLPGAPSFALGGPDATLVDAVRRFGGLGADDRERLEFVVPLVAEPVRRARPRLARAAVRPVILAGTPAERLAALAAQTEARRRALADLARRAGRSLEERAAEEEEERALRRPRAAPRQRTEAEAEAESELEAALGTLYRSLTGAEPLTPSDEAALIEWLVSAVLSGRVTEGVDYARAYQNVRRRLIDAAFGPAQEAAPQGRRTLLAFLQQIDAVVDDARDIERRAATSRERVPIFNRDTGDVVAYEEVLPEADEPDPSEVAIAVVRGVPVRVPDAVARAEGVVDVARVQCHACRRWRAVRPEAMAQRVDYAVRYDGALAQGPGVAPATGEAGALPVEAECTRFGIEFQHTLPTRQPPVDGVPNVERVPMDSQYVVVRATGAPLALLESAPEAMRPVGTPTVEGFGVATAAPGGDGPYYDIEFGLLPGRAFLVPAAAVSRERGGAGRTRPLLLLPDARGRPPAHTRDGPARLRGAPVGVRRPDHGPALESRARTARAPAPRGGL
jgi:hypothetical protein